MLAHSERGKMNEPFYLELLTVLRDFSRKADVYLFELLNFVILRVRSTEIDNNVRRFDKLFNHTGVSQVTVSVYVYLTRTRICG